MGGAGASIALLCGALPSSAESQPLQSAIEYHADARCPNWDTFYDSVRERARVENGEPWSRRVFRVELVDDGESAHGVVTVLEGGAEQDRKTLQGANCGEVANAAALVVAILSEPESAPAASDSAAPSAEPSPSASAQNESALPKRLEPSPAPRAREPTLRGSIGIQAATATVVAPSLVWGARANFDVARPHLGPSLRLSAVAAFSGARTTELGTAHWTWLAARLDACPFAAHVRLLSVEPCAFFEGGSVIGSGSGTVNAETHAVQWWAPGVLGRLRLPLWSPLNAEIEVGGFYPLSRPRFFFRPDTVAYEVPARPGMTVAAGLELSLW